MEERKKSVQHFLWYLAGYKSAFIKNNKVDSFHATLIGTLLFIVGIYATLAWTFFFQTVTTNFIIALCGGVFMGLFIVSFDRALIASLSIEKPNIYSLGFRLVLAALLGVFLAQPMVLKFYENDISREAQILVDKKNQERKKELEAIYSQEIELLNAEKQKLQDEIDAKREVVLKAENDFKKEMDGSGGTGRWGYNIVSKQKQKILEQHQVEYEKLYTQSIPKIDTITNRLNAISDKISADFEAFKVSNTQYGILLRAEALQSLLTKDTSGTLRMRYWLLCFILALIELSALIAKMLFKTKAYKSQVAFVTEQEVLKYEGLRDIEVAHNEAWKTQAKAYELEGVDLFFSDMKISRDKGIKTLINEWEGSRNISGKELFEKYEELYRMKG